jgi:prepilin-type N-terminal cleavage/methylation domain-containing protein
MNATTIANPIRLRRRAGTRGFTLMEMMVTLAIFILLAAAVFGIMTGVLQSTSTLQDNQNRRDDVEAFSAFLKKKLSELPSSGTVGSYLRGEGEGLIQNGIIMGTTNVATAIDAKVQPNGYYSLRLATFTTMAGQDQPQDARQVLQTAVTTDDPTLIWTPLMTDVKTLDWKFLDFNTTLWVDTWNSTANPNLLEFTMQMAGDLQPTTLDVWLPLITPVSVRIGRSPVSSGSTSPTPTPTPRSAPPPPHG